MSIWYSRLRMMFDNFTLLLIAVVVFATFVPAHGQGAIYFEWITNAAIALLLGVGVAIMGVSGAARKLCSAVSTRAKGVESARPDNAAPRRSWKAAAAS